MILGLASVAGCATPDTGSSDANQVALRSEVLPRVGGEDANVRTVGFLVAPGVYNSELMAPYDVFQHSVFRDTTDYMETFIVSADGLPVETFEGIIVAPHFSFDDVPEIDVLVIPSTIGSLDRDLADERYMNWVRGAVDAAEWVVTVCDGAFPLAATGALDGRVATTFPGDREAFAQAFPDIDVKFDARLVVDGKYITSVGGAMSYEPAFWLVEHLYGKEHADRTAEGLVWPWDASEVPTRIAPQTRIRS